LEYELPPERIARHPVEPRDAARLMVAPRFAGAPAEHALVRDLPRFLRAGDLLVLNTTRVLPARFVGVNEGTGAGVQGLYLSPHGPPPAQSGQRRRWQVLLKMRRHRAGARVRLLDRHGRASDVVLVLEGRAEDDDGGWIVAVESPDGEGATDQELLGRVGLAPLPPYILASRKREEEAGRGCAEDEAGAAYDLETYQTVYADPARAGSVAAPTAGLHFTPRLLGELDAMGVRTAGVVLHVGMGTFKPVETEFVEQHPMHAEWCTLPAATARAIMETRRRGGRVFAVGTTSARTLESFDDLGEITSDASKATRLLITPGYRFRNLDGLMTNFHLPHSTLLAMVAALLEEPGKAPGGLARLLAYYREAIAREYRFFSFGDAMLIVP
jgi:S-adenosylmethionine:tRNA ribosyltransferase-isomerase